MIILNTSPSNSSEAEAFLKATDPTLSIANSTSAIATKAIVEYLSLLKHGYILNFGALNDTSLAYLSKLGHDHLYGIDSNKKVYDQPYYTQVKYSYSPMDNTHFPKSFFDVVYTTDPSGYFATVEAVKKFMEESRRILVNGGQLLFTLPPRFSQKEIEEIAEHAQTLGFNKTQKGHPYTPGGIPLFILGLSKQERKNKFEQINLVCLSVGKGEGMDVCYQTLKKRFEQVGIRAPIYKTYDEVDKKYLSIIGYVPSYQLVFPKSGNYLIDAHQTQASSRFWLEVKNIAKDVARNPLELLRVAKIILFHFDYAFQTTKRLQTTDNKMLGEHFLVLRTNELAQASGFKNYTIMPLSSFGPSHTNKHSQKEIHIGSFGFATKGKHFDQICELAKRLGVKATIWMGASRMNDVSEKTTNYIAEDIYNRYHSDKIKIRVGEYSEEELLEGMKECTHFISAQGDVMVTSASLRHMIWLGKPVISVDNYIAKEAQVHRVGSLDDITLEYLSKTTELTNLDDGFRYLLKILEELDLSKDPAPE